MGAYDPYGVLPKVNAVADQLGVPEQLADAIASQESGLDPYRVGDYGTSYGLFQLHKGGELPASWAAGPYIQGHGGQIPVQATDPTANANVALSVVANVERAHPTWSPGQIAAAAQRPADQAGYARSINDKVGAVSTYGALTQSPTAQSASIQGDVGKAAGNVIGGVVGAAGKAIEEYIISQGPFIRLAEFVAGTYMLVIASGAILGLLAYNTHEIRQAGSTASKAPGLVSHGAKTVGKIAEVGAVVIPK